MPALSVAEVSQAYVAANQLQLIICQKMFAMCGV